MLKVINMININSKFLYYLGAIIFHGVILLTNFGNFFHGGTALELVILDVAAVFIVVMCIKLFHKAKNVEKFAIVLLALIPAIAVGMSLFSGVKRVFVG